MKNIRTVFLFAMAVMAIVFISCSKEEAGGMNLSDETFMQSAAYSDLAEIDFGNMALGKTTTDSVRLFASSMVGDHTKNFAALRDSLARELNYKDLPTGINADQQAVKLQISSYTGYSFDTAYINGQIRDHQTAIALYQSEINNGFNKSIKAFASDKLPMLHAHLDFVKVVSRSLHP